MSCLRRIGLLTVLFACLAAQTAIAAEIPVDKHGLPLWEVREWTDFPVRIEVEDNRALDELLAQVPLAEFHREDVGRVPEGKGWRLVVEPRVTEEEFAALVDAGYAPVRIRDVEREGREAVERAWAETAGKAAKDHTFPLTAFPTTAEIGTIIDEIVALDTSIARAFQWGYSVQGRELWGIVISSDVTSTRAEAEVRLSSNMHGDETVGMVMLLDFAQYLVANYGQPGYDDVTNLVDEYEIHIMPQHNPDGYVLDQRYNANGVDLNRNFLEPGGSDTVQEIENVNYMAYANSNHFVVSINGHGGALVANYIWDYTYTLAPDDAAAHALALEYSTYNLPMYNGAFTEGVTNGAEWYVALGTVQDWSYDQTGCIDTTMELSNTKWPAASTLAGFWDDNRESLMHYVKAARYGVNGVVTGSDTGLPLDATVTVTGNSKSVYTDPEHGDYYKLLPSGTYQLTFEADGYIAQTISGVSTTWGTPTVLDVALDPVAHGSIAGNVYEAGGAPIEARVDAYTHPLNVLTATVYSDAGDGSYDLSGLVYGDYRLVYSAANHTTEEQVVTLDAATVTAPDVLLGLVQDITPFASDFEGPSTTGWVFDGNWGTIADGADGSAYSMTDSPAGDYYRNESYTCAMDAGVDLSTMDSGSVSYWAKWEIETNWDGVQFQVSTDGGSNWTPISTSRTQSGSGQGAQNSGEPYYEGTQAAWVHEDVDLAPWIGETDVRFRFLIVTDSSVYKDGFYFDEFLIDGVGEIGTGVGDAPAAPTLAGVFPNPFNPSTSVVFTMPRAGRATVAIYDVQGRLVRTLVDGSVAAGRHEPRWDGRADDGAAAATGVYFVRFRAFGEESVAKALLLK